MPDRNELSPGTRVGPYTVAETIGSGGFGVVYAATNAGGVRVAIKVLHADLVRSPDAVLRFEREIEVLLMLSHPNMIEILGLGRLDDGRPYFAMPFLEGQDLSQRLRDCGRLSPSDAADILDPVCKALGAAHELGVVHRDIKASNVFLTGDGRVLLLDFGIAKLVDEGGPALTTSWQVLGTPAYRAPEQIGKTADARSDVYALGALCFKMLTGRAPFSGDTATMMQHLHRHARRPRPSIRANVSVAFDTVIVRAMSADPGERYATARDFVVAFRAALARSNRDESAVSGMTDHVPALAVHVSFAESRRGADDDAELFLEELGRLHSAARRWFVDEGFRAVLEGSRVLVMVMPLPGDSDADRRARRSAVETASDLLAGAQGRRVHLDITIHEDTAVVLGADVVGGPVLDLGTWVADSGQETVQTTVRLQARMT